MSWSARELRLQSLMLGEVLDFKHDLERPWLGEV